MNNDTIMENFNIDDEEDYEVPEEYYIDVEKIVPGFIGWVKYGGDFLLGKVISRNKKKKNCLCQILLYGWIRQSQTTYVYGRYI